MSSAASVPALFETTYTELSIADSDAETSPVVVPASHRAQIDAATAHTTRCMFVGLNVRIRSVAQLTDLLAAYYEYLLQSAIRFGHPLTFESTIVLPLTAEHTKHAPATGTDVTPPAAAAENSIPISTLPIVDPLTASATAAQSASGVRFRSLMIPDVEAFLTTESVEMKSINTERSARGLPEVVTLSIAAALKSSTASNSSSSSGGDSKRAAYAHDLTLRREVVIGGTFDHLHSGHKILIHTAAFIATRLLVCGLSADALLVKKKFGNRLQPWLDRHADFVRYVQIVNPFIRVDVHPLHDPFGPSTVRPTLTCLVVSKETISGGEKINTIRTASRLSTVDVVVVDLVGRDEHPTAPATATAAAVSSSTKKHTLEASNGAAATAEKKIRTETATVPVTAAAPAEPPKVSSTEIREAVIAESERRIAALQLKWKSLATSAGASESVAAEWWTLISAHYSEPQRAYHTLPHIDQMLGLIDSYRARLVNASEVAFAAWFHDIIYQPTKSDNEELSRDVWTKFATQIKLDAKSIAAVSSYILATKTHALPSGDTASAADVKHSTADSDAGFLLDFDMSILARPVAEYERYGRQIRFEYSHMPDSAYRTGRIAVLSKMLASGDKLYSTALCREKWLTRARYNISAEIARLKA